MNTGDLEHQIDELFREISLEPGVEGKSNGSVSAKSDANLFRNGSVPELLRAGISTELPPVEPPSLKTVPGKHHKRAFNRTARRSIPSRIAHQISYKHVLVLVALITIILVGIGIPRLMS